jgi:hypothetical protein
MRRGLAAFAEEVRGLTFACPADGCRRTLLLPSSKFVAARESLAIGPRFRTCGGCRTTVSVLGIAGGELDLAWREAASHSVRR